MSGDQDDDLHEIEGLVARTQERASGALDARVVHAIGLAAGIAGAMDELDGRPAPRREWRRAAAIAAAVVALVGAAVFMVATESGWFGGKRPTLQVGVSPPAIVDDRASAPSSASAATIEPAISRDDAALRDTPAARRETPRRSAADEEADRLAAVAAGKTANKGSGAGAGGPALPPRDPPPGSSLDAIKTAAAARIIARLTPLGEPAERGGTRFSGPGRRPIEARITALYKSGNGGEDGAALLDATVEVSPGEDSGQTSFLGWDDAAPEEFWRPETTFVACFNVLTRANTNGVRRLRIALARGFRVTLLTGDLPPLPSSPDDATVTKLLRRDLAASLADPRAAVRASAITALRHYESTDDRFPAAPKNLWRDPRVAAGLLAAARDADPRVRWNAAWMDPASGGDAGVVLLRELFFDPVPLVREAAEHWLDGPDGLKLVEQRQKLDDPPFAERHSRVVLAAPIRLASGHDVDEALEVLDGHRDPARRMQSAEALGGAAGLEDDAATHLAVVGLARALEDGDVDVRRAAAESLGMLGDATIVGRLPSRVEREEPRVRVAAAAAQVRLGDLTALAMLRALTRGRDARSSAQAVHVVGELATDLAPIRRELLTILFDAYGVDDPAVRGEVLVTLASLANDLEPDERGRLDALLAEAAGDDALYVVVAAQVAPVLIARALAAGDAESNRLRELGYAAGEIIDQIGYGGGEGK